LQSQFSADYRLAGHQSHSDKQDEKSNHALQWFGHVFLFEIFSQSSCVRSMDAAGRDLAPDEVENTLRIITL